VSNNLKIERAIALEFERIAIHVGDLSAMCTDVAYQLGSAGFGALRTPIINMTQAWGGNRFGKGLVRAGGTHYPLTNDLVAKLKDVLTDFEWRFDEIAERTFTLPSVLKRFEGIGRVSNKQVNLMGSVGMVAKMAGLKRDTRHNLPFGIYKDLQFEPVLHPNGDVWARGALRRDEIKQSIELIRDLLTKLDGANPTEKPVKPSDLKLKPNTLTVSLTEGWRGEICHVAISNTEGDLLHYKIKDPSMHNWKSLELSLRNLEISDFPINNKSYDLSYCGHDL
jgi:Ni,Fe-hydrogenase III large subunit